MSDLIEKLWPAFQAECNEQVEALELGLVRGAAQTRDVNALFRHFHTLKGGCAMMGFASMEAVAHACEDLLDPVRKGERPLSDALVDVLLAALDCLKRQLASVEATRRDPAPAPELLARLRAMAADDGQAPAVSAPAPAASPSNDITMLARAANDAMPLLATAALGEAPPAAGTAAALQALQTAAVEAAPAVATLAQAFANAAGPAARQAALAELLERLAWLESCYSLAAGTAAAAAITRPALESGFRAAIAAFGDTLAATLADAARDAAVDGAVDGAGSRPRGQDSVTALEALLLQTRLLCLPESTLLLRFLRQILRELERHGIALGAELEELLRVAAVLPLELLPGAAEDAAYVAMCQQLQATLQQALADCRHEAGLQRRRAAIAAHCTVAAATLDLLDAAALDALEAALARDDTVVEIETDLEAMPDGGRAFVDWLAATGTLIGNHTAAAAAGERGASPRLVLLAALPQPLAAVRAAVQRFCTRFDLHCGNGEDDSGAAPPAADTATATDTATAMADAGHDARASSAATMRIASASVDAFVNRVGEMVTLRNVMAHTLYRDDLASRQARVKQLLRERSAQRPLTDFELEDVRQLLADLALQQEQLTQADARLQGTLSRLQEDVLALRVVPISLVFNRLPRVVRDLGHQLGRDVQLDISGEDVRIDKGMVDVLVEPLLHLVRNALDHGIEPPAARLAAGKPARATLAVRARQHGNALFVEVADDGRGLDRERIRQKAAAQGLVSESEAATLSERELDHLIFLPGFSTAAEVTEVSGRGVGMDAVKTRVQQLGGQVEVNSRNGRGACFTLRLPLSAAIQSVLLVAAGGRQLALPERSVTEILSLPADSLQSVQGQACCLLRGATLPLYHLAALLGYGDSVPAPGRLLEVVVLTDGVYRIGLVVEQVLGRPEVFMRDIHPDLARLPGVGGASVLGDGRVVIILDSDKLFELALRQAQSLRSLLRAS